MQFVAIYHNVQLAKTFKETASRCLHTSEVWLQIENPCSVHAKATMPYQLLAIMALGE
jgi:hypothetical protein